MSSTRAARPMCLLILWLVSAPALAWEPFRSQNGEVLQGNEHLAKNQLPEALAAYEAAAKRLPNEPGVHLDRGLALLKSGKLPEAREALRLATQGGQDAELRGKAHYNLGLAFLREAEAAAKQENHEEAQKLLREAVDAFKGSLRASPRNRDAAWNLELTRRRLLDQEKKQQEKKQQEDEKKKQEEEQKKQEEEQKKQDGQEGEQPDDQKQQQEDDAGQEQGEPDAGGQQQGEPQGERDAGAPKQPDQPEPDPSQEQQREGDQRPQPAMPEHMQKALDALEDSEENLQKHRAAQRARQRPRRVEKDW